MRFRRLVMIMMSVVSLACSSPPRAPSDAKGSTGDALPQLPPVAHDPYSPSLVVEGVSPAALPFPDKDDAALTPIDRKTHDRAREAARAGRFHEAKRLLGRLASSYSSHEILIAQYNAV